MRRWALRILLFLLVGAIVNVAVAWGHAIIFPVRISLARSELIFPSSDPHWEVDVLPRRGGLMVIARAWDNGARQPGSSDKPPSWSIASVPPSPDDCARQREVCEVGYGWPMLSLYSRGPVGREYLLPHRPIWRGICVNTLVFSVVGGLAVMSLRLVGLRRRLRIKRGLCPKCAYDLRGTPDTTACPECGAVRLST